ncbi:xanthine dehydrogenase family protein molybdopterin-binding subunit [Arthrospiribacter ruber]|uniref:Xanthine dehydrogenase family protein molybdopterin-binding subunit n=1 Tax=Arthrospiribacter ruber TaxID=2487934 RepID=A0A951J171_9BACT|nr:molybdopterin cofactor-binding domain-containing protein [Arthrospiribacter ruber]MBW3468948.1 xanthine dehydrogenase family protein molybdopterin-binding subunit [Arthrospiribacter ruber]
MAIPKPSRRDFLKTSGHLLIGFNLLPLAYCQPKDEEGLGYSTYEGIPERPHLDKNLIDSWIRLDADGHVTVLTGKQELGQGIRTALLQIAAEELDVDIDRCHIINGDTGQTANEGYTAGSNSVEGSGKAIREAAATARNYMLSLASVNWDIDIESLEVKNGEILGPSGQKASYWELLDGKYLESKVDNKIAFKDAKNHQVIGNSILREDILNMVLGKTHFVHDLRLPGMLHARIVHPPSYSARLVSVDVESAISLQGVLKVIQDGSFLAVVAKREYQAIRAWEKLKELSTWESEKITVLPDQLFEDLKRKSQSPQTIEQNNSILSKINQSNKKHRASFFRPYHMHGSTGPSCALAKWEAGKLTVWSPTQGVYPLRNTLADLFDINEESIRCIGLPGSGCYGHNGADDVSAEAALIAKAFPNVPIRLQWMRENEHMWEPYGSAMRIELSAGMDAQGLITAWDTQIWSDTHSTRPRGDAGNYVSARHLENPFTFDKGGFSGGSYRNATPLYNISDKRLLLHNYDGPLRTSALRGLGAYGNIFALESFIDELSHLADQDPLNFRKNNLDDPRAIAVLDKLAKETGYHDRIKKSDTGYGLAFAKYKNSAAYLAVLAEVTVFKDKKSFHLKRLTAVIDAGLCINPDGLINQTEGGMIQSASWTLLEEVHYDENGILSKDWNSYPILRAMKTPEVKVHVINRPEEKPLGAGEAAQGPVAAAIANAVFDGTGTRVRDLPIKAEKIDW